MRPQQSQSFAPAKFNSNVELTHRFRFISNAAIDQQIYAGQLLLAAGCLKGSAANTLVPLNSSVRLCQVEAWAPPASQGSSSTVSVFWVAGANQFGSRREVSDTTNSVSQPAHVVTGPPALSYGSFWQQPTSYNGGYPLFELTCPSGTIVNIVVNLIMADGATSFEQAVTSSAYGNIYYMCLDAVANNHLSPVSLSTTS